MSYLTRKEETVRDLKYSQLENKATSLVDQVSVWVADASNLHTDSPAGSEKTDVVSMRNQFIEDLRAQLGV